MGQAHVVGDNELANSLLRNDRYDLHVIDRRQFVLVRDRFAAAPVPNQDGSPGIMLHLMIDEQVPKVDPIGFHLDRQASEQYQPGEFDHLKLGGRGTCGGYFGTAILRSTADCDLKPEAWRQVFRYGLLAERLMRSNGEPSTSTGIAEIRGNDFIVTLERLNRNESGNYTFDIDPDPNEATIIEVFPVDVAHAATFMHELGHALNLRHRGSGDFIGRDSSKRDINRRCLETYVVARWADLRRKSRFAYTRNVIPLGDFNLPKVDPDDPVFQALTSRGLHLPEHSTEMGSSIATDHHYDQIAFFPGPTGDAFVQSGVFDFDGALFSDLWDQHGEDVYFAYVRYFISDHRPLWAEFRTI